MEDLEAVALLQRGDIDGLDPLVTRYQTKAARVAYLVTHDTQLAEDVMQTAFVRAYERIHQFDTTRPFEPWFMRIVVNLALKAMNRQPMYVHLTAADVLPDVGSEPPHALETAEMEAAVREALAALTPEQRAVIVLRYYLGYTEQEISSHVGSPLGTIRWRLHAARKRLKGLLLSLTDGYADKRGTT